MAEIRRVSSIPKPSSSVVTIKSQSEIAAQKGYAPKGGVTTAPTMTHNDHQARIDASKPKRGSQPKVSALAAPALKVETVQTPVSAPSVPKVVAVKVDPAEEFRQAVSSGRMAPGEASIRLEAKLGSLKDLDGALVQWRLSQTLPAGVSIFPEFKALAAARGGIKVARVERTYANPLVDQLREQVRSGQVDVATARGQLTRAVVIKDPVLGKRTHHVTVGSSMTARVVMPEALISAPITDPDEKEAGKIVSVTFTMLRRGASEEEQAKALLQATARKSKSEGRALSWTVDSAFLAWQQTGELPDGLALSTTDIEVEATKAGPAGKILAWAVGMLDNNADCQRVEFAEGTVLTLYYNSPSADPQVRAILGDPRGDGIVLRRFWIGDGKDESANLKASSKGKKFLGEGLKVGTLKLSPGTDASKVEWPRALKPGQYALPGTAKVPVLDRNGDPTGDFDEVPAVHLMQHITGYKVDHVLRHEAIRADKRGEALPTVENSLSATGKRGSAVCKQPNYDRNPKWQKSHTTTRATFSHG